MPPLTLIFLSAAGFFAGFVDAMAGGGGLISLPALVAAGLPPHAALATNKVQSAIGTTISAGRYLRNGHVHMPVAVTAFIFSFIGSFAGAWVVMRVPGDSLEAIIPALIILVGVITFIRKNFGAEDRFGEMLPKHYIIAAGFAFALGFYDGFFGPGTGSFFAFGFVFFFHFGFVRATGNAKVANLASNYAAIAAFLLGGHIVWIVALVMGAANLAGAWLGAGLAMRGGAKIIKPVFGVVLLGLLVKIVFFS
ncbi:MAG: TSUP family transporter [Ignavibacteria bacterium]|nr:TSUP family transporter [Ignavibacteria bacterium]